jgi:Zn ribbon nucleic-acid-binding protein
MAKTHYNPTEVTEDMDVRRIMMRKTACGSKATDRAALYMSNNWDHVDCAKCLAKREEVERIAAHRAKMAELKNK